MKRVVLDIETSGLLEPNLDYSKMPYRLKQDFKLWCIVLRDLDTNEVQTLVIDQCTKENLKEALKDCTEVIGHNIALFDLPVLMLLDVLEYEIGYPGKPSLVFGNECLITDTLLLSKLLLPDRFDKHGKHSLKSWGLRTGNFKGDFDDFSQYSEAMLSYCIQDTSTNAQLYRKLLADKNANKASWDRAYSMEVKLADLTLKQSVFGFKFDIELAKQCLDDLDEKLKTIKAKVDPLMPDRKLTKGEEKFYEWPKKPFLKTAELASSAIKFADKIGGTIEGTCADDAYLVFNGEKYKFTERKKLDVKMKADIDDLDNLKAYLLSLGWAASEWGERDLLKKQDKTKKTKEEVLDTINRYVQQTFNGYYSEERCELIGCAHSETALLNHLVKLAAKDKPIWVPKSPKLAVGLEKNICPGLEVLGEKAEFVGDVVKYLTYKHRRSSILGGNAEYDPEDEEEPEKGFLAHVREDGRIPTPADTVAANTGRYRHRVCVNVPRVSSLYGDKMRAMFGAGNPWWQLGFDFASLEGRIQGHFCLPYTNGEELAKQLTAEKPNSIHCVKARELSISRTDAKSVVYASIFGAQPKKLAKMLGISISQAEGIFHAFWESVPALAELKYKIEQHWEANGKTGIKGLDGRMLSSRSKHSLVNLCFQGGAVFVKWSVVRICQTMEEQGILGDPFIHTEKDVKIFQMIVSHDEIQYACHPKLLEVKNFETEDAAKQNLTKNCSSIGQGTKGYYFANETLPVTCINAGIKQAEQELKIRVPMGIEWAVGKNWKQCH